MPIRGPLGVRRPFAEQTLEINFTEREIELNIRGPFGMKRRLAVPNPGVTEDEVAECLEGESANKFIRGVLLNSPFKPSNPQESLEWQEAYCRGTLEAIKREYDNEMSPLSEAQDQVLNELRDERAAQLRSAESTQIQETESGIVVAEENLGDIEMIPSTVEENGDE